MGNAGALPSWGTVTVGFHYLQRLRNHAVTLASFHTSLSAIIAPTESLVSTRGPTLDVQARLQLGLVVDRESPQAGHQLRMVSLEVWVVEMMVGPAVPGVVVAVLDGWIRLPEAVQIELADEAREVGGLEGVGAVRGPGAGAGGQDLPLEEVLIDDDGLAGAVPADGFVGGVVHQTPQLGREVVGVDAVREGAFVHAVVCRGGNRGSEGW